MTQRVGSRRGGFMFVPKVLVVVLVLVLALLGACGPAVLARKHAGAELALAEVRDVVIGEEKVERPFYFSYWVVPKDSPYTSLQDLKGKRVAFPSPLSTSGYVFPMARLGG